MENTNGQIDLVIRVERRWVVVTLDTGANQTSTPNRLDGLFVVSTTCDAAIHAAARYAYDWGYSYATADDAQQQTIDSLEEL